MTPRKARQSMQAIKKRRDATLAALVERSPYVQYLGVRFDRRGDELTCILPFSKKLIGNPLLPAIHGGVTSAFLEITSVVTLTWATAWNDIEAETLDPDAEVHLPRFPKTIDFTIDYLRSGLPEDAYARARITRAGRRYSSVHVEGWQDNRSKLFAQATGHFLMPKPRT